MKDGKAEHITREPEQVKAFRDTWRDGIHSYLTYLRDRLTVARDLLTESGSIFVQIGDENVHRVRAVMDEVFGEENFVNLISIKKTGSAPITESVFDYLLWFSRSRDQVKLRRLFQTRKEATVDAKMNTLLDGAMYGHRTTGMGDDAVQHLLERGCRMGPGSTTRFVSQDHDSIGSGSEDYSFNGTWKQCGPNPALDLREPGRLGSPSKVESNIRWWWEIPRGRSEALGPPRTSDFELMGGRKG